MTVKSRHIQFHMMMTRCWGWWLLCRRDGGGWGDSDGGQTIEKGLDLGSEGGMDGINFHIKCLMAVCQRGVTLGEAVDCFFQSISSHLSGMVVRHGERAGRTSC